ncbi:MAG TPA: radical SAM protein [Candidatus Pacearchaeota archaeon]|nr:radical SAM protein [Candidatus Pacearchaeota archaeon]
MKDSSFLKIKLLSQGVDFEKEPKGIMKTVKEEYRALFDARLSPEHTLNLPPEIVLPGDIVAKTIYRPNSEYLIKESEEGPILVRKSGEEITPVKFPPRPEYYNEKTSSGIPMNQVGQLLGLDCMGIILNSYCSRADNNKQCKFCNINPTTGEKSDNIRNLEEIIETVRRAYNDKAFNLVNLTGGTFKDSELEFVTYLNYSKKIREILQLPFLPGVSSINPPNKDLLKKYEEELKASNFDLVTYNLEVWDKDLLKKVCPGKDELGGRDRYIKSAKSTIEILGKGHVGIIFTVGPWESVNSILNGCDQLAKEGILPIPVVFHPGKGAEYSWMGTTNEKDLVYLYQSLYPLYQNNKLIPENRTRPAGSEKSFRNSLINESVLGYLN